MEWKVSRYIIVLFSTSSGRPLPALMRHQGFSKRMCLKTQKKKLHSTEREPQIAWDRLLLQQKYIKIFKFVEILGLWAFRPLESNGKLTNEVLPFRICFDTSSLPCYLPSTAQHIVVDHVHQEHRYFKANIVWGGLPKMTSHFDCLKAMPKVVSMGRFHCSAKLYSVRAQVQLKERLWGKAPPSPAHASAPKKEFVQVV